MLGCGGGAIEAVRTTVRCAWGKFRELSPILTLRGMSLKMKGKIYRACVQSVLVYGSETWALKVSDTQQLRENGKDDGEMDVRSVTEGQEKLAGVVGSVGYCWCCGTCGMW